MILYPPRRRGGESGWEIIGVAHSQVVRQETKRGQAKSRMPQVLAAQDKVVQCLRRKMP
jgi:hypothetical protein